MTSDYELRDAQPTDFDRLLELYRAAFEDLVERARGGQTDTWWRTEFQGDFDAGGMSVIVVDGVDVGILDVRRQPGSIALSTIAIGPAHQRQGLGTKIMRDLMKSEQHITLSVVIGNTAEQWYRQLGFREERRTDTRVHLLYQSSSDHA